METVQSDKFFEDKSPTDTKEEAPKLILTASVISFDFDFITSDPTKSRADEIKVLLVKNKKPPKRSKEGKPPGIGVPTGQFESKETAPSAAEREMEDETGCVMRKIIGKLFVVHKLVKVDGNPAPNEIHVFLVEASEAINKVKEIDEIDASFEPWVPLRQAFEMPKAQDKNGGNKNPNGIYFQHLKRLHRAIYSMVYDVEDLIDGKAASKWLEPNRRSLINAMVDLQRDGLLDEFLPKDDPEEMPA